MRKLTHRPGSTARSFIAIAVAACVLVAGWMAVSPELHEKLHHDAGDAHHECLVTMIAAGGVDQVTVVPVVVVAVAPFTTSTIALHPVWVRPLFLNGSVLEHAPPVLA